MMSRSSSSKGLVRDGVRRSLWAVVLSTLAFVVSMLLPSLMNMQQALENRKGMIVDGARASELAQSWKSSLADAAIYIGGENALVKLAVILLAVVAGTAMFAYLHDKRKVDFYHSLPVSREKLYLVNFVTGAVCVIAPYLVLRVLTLVCAHAMGFGEAVSVGTYLGVILCDILFFLLMYAMSALSTILCGNTIIALLLQLWVYLAPLAIQMMHEGLLSLYCKTYDSISYSDLFNHLRLSPAATYFMVNGANYGSGLADNFIRAGKPAYMLLAEYAAAALFIIALGVFAFRRRKSERAGTALAFRPLRLPVKAFMCIVMGTAFAIGFRLIGGKQAIHTHTQTANSEPLMAITKQYGLERVWMNAQRAEELGISDGDTVEVSNEQHTGKVQVKVTQRINPDALYMPSHYGCSSKEEKTAYGVGLRQMDYVPFRIEPGYGGICSQEAVVTVKKVGA